MNSESIPLCKIETRLTGYGYSNSTSTWKFVIDLESEKKKRTIRQWNIKFGNTEQCGCQRCDPDTRG